MRLESVITSLTSEEGERLFSAGVWLVIIIQGGRRDTGDSCITG